MALLKGVALERCCLLDETAKSQQGTGDLSGLPAFLGPLSQGCRRYHSGGSPQACGSRFLKFLGQLLSTFLPASQRSLMELVTAALELSCSRSRVAVSITWWEGLQAVGLVLL